jgi:hypothetical protein
LYTVEEIRKCWNFLNYNWGIFVIWRLMENGGIFFGESFSKEFFVWIFGEANCMDCFRPGYLVWKKKLFWSLKLDWKIHEILIKRFFFLFLLSSNSHQNIPNFGLEIFKIWLRRLKVLNRNFEKTVPYKFQNYRRNLKVPWFL